MKTHLFIGVFLSFVFCILSETATASNIDRFLESKAKAEFIVCANGAKGCYNVIVPKVGGGRVYNEIYGSIEVDFERGVIFAQSKKNDRRVRKFNFDVSRAHSRNCASEEAKRFIIEKYLGLELLSDIQAPRGC